MSKTASFAYSCKAAKYRALYILDEWETMLVKQLCEQIALSCIQAQG